MRQRRMWQAGGLAGTHYPRPGQPWWSALGAPCRAMPRTARVVPSIAPDPVMQSRPQITWAPRTSHRLQLLQQHHLDALFQQGSGGLQARHAGSNDAALTGASAPLLLRPTQLPGIHVSSHRRAGASSRGRLPRPAVSKSLRLPAYAYSALHVTMVSCCTALHAHRLESRAAEGFRRVSDCCSTRHRAVDAVCWTTTLACAMARRRPRGREGSGGE